MVRDGIPYVTVPLILALVPVLLGYWYLAIPLVLLALFMAYFFRDPQRTAPLEEGIVLAPAAPPRY